MKKYWLGLLLLGLIVSSCEKKPKNVTVDEIAGNEEVRQFMEAFEGRGIMSDESHTTPASEALNSFQYPDDLAMDLMLAEPQIHQPVDISFDHRGRLWVVQYNQYPYPEGVKVVDIDHHIRAIFDKVPEAPPAGVKGADKITIFEDSNHDGRYDQATDAISGLNITTGVALGRRKIWVLTPPYLLAYPDQDGDGIPNGDPEVHLSGFGLEDTHAVANNLRWGPDGWLYGAQGSTTTANIDSKVTKNVHFKGQAIWRYHPETMVFEIFGEGGGNTFDVEIDEKGRIYSGDNGTTRGFYYKQGGYYRKNWGKHGALTNPYAYGHIPGLELEGEKIRFTHAWIKYEGGSLPERYRGKILALNPLLNFVQITRFESEGSTFKGIDEEKILQTEDHWFRPVDIKAGPDGGVYLADWNDSRLSHIDPRDTWDKTTGRVYRLRNKKNTQVASFDLSTYSNEQLTKLLSSPNKWFRQQALRIFGDRKDLRAVPQLLKLLKSGNAQEALEALWAIHLSGGYTDDIALKTLDHWDPYVRLWSIRLIGDQRKASKKVSEKLAQLASKEKHLEVIGQLASSVKRLPPIDAIPIVSALLRNRHSLGDWDNQLLIWWALEAKAETGREQVLKLFEDPGFWKEPLVKDFVLQRLAQRYTQARGRANYNTCAKLFEFSPSEEFAGLLFEGMQEGLRGQDIANLPSNLLAIIQKYQAQFGEGKWSLAMRQNDQAAIQKVLTIVQDKRNSRSERLAYIKILGEINQPGAIPVLLKIMESHDYSDGIRIASLNTLRHYNDDTIGEKVAAAYPDKLRANPELRKAALWLFASRASWANQLLSAITVTRQVSKQDVPIEIVRQFKLLDDPSIVAMVDGLWPEVKIASTNDKKNEILRIKKALKSQTGSIADGKNIYTQSCGNCHQLNGEGGTIGPDLTGYDRKNISDLTLNIVDPNAAIREGYVNYRIKLKDEQVILGRIVERSGGNMIVKPLGGIEIVLTDDQIEEAVPQDRSMMPEHLTESLSEQEIRDLFAYIGQ